MRSSESFFAGIVTLVLVVLVYLTINVLPVAVDFLISLLPATR